MITPLSAAEMFHCCNLCYKRALSSPFERVKSVLRIFQSPGVQAVQFDLHSIPPPKSTSDRCLQDEHHIRILRRDVDYYLAVPTSFRSRGTSIRCIIIQRQHLRHLHIFTYKTSIISILRQAAAHHPTTPAPHLTRVKDGHPTPILTRPAWCPATAIIIPSLTIRRSCASSPTPSATTSARPATADFSSKSPNTALLSKRPLPKRPWPKSLPGDQLGNPYCQSCNQI